MILVGSHNANVGFADGMKILRAGGSALDAVEATIRAVESNPNDHSVGYGGLPNILGEVELDASIMDGRALETGAVCAVKNIEHVITLARAVMEKLPHVLLAGAGAERLARELGFETRALLTPDAQDIFQGRVTTKNLRYDTLRDLVARATRDPEIAATMKDYFGTVNVIARDARGNIASGVSTSGWAWKYPGRVGDSPIIGAGNYADNRYGACGCTGYGEMAQRCNTAHSVVLYMKLGKNLDAACREAMEDLRQLSVPFPPGLNLVAMDARGNHAAYTTETEREVKYVFQTDEMNEYETRRRVVVPLKDN
ncbi:MAG: N(4)-(beta-N-acetylglucosaminyl)-L-asparaginase [Chloroflexi bacterium]|nr:N(4)-(beta-N-acetylglucosaminyl)-L-asparaginase [Chloroflexota bacterium]